MSVENEKTKSDQNQGLWPHEILFLLLLGAALYCSQYHEQKWPEFVYGTAILGALPVFWFRCRQEFRQLPNRGFFLGLTAVWLALFSLLGISTFQIIGSPSLFGWLFNVYSSPAVDEQHGMLIPFAVLGLVIWKRKELAAQRLDLWWPGIWLVAAGLFLHLVGFRIQQPRFSVIGFFIGLYGLMGLAWGPKWLKAMAFPYLLFAFSVPIGELLGPITLKLRILVATIVAFISQCGLAPDVIHQGTQLVDSQNTFHYEVAAACSGMRSVVAMLALTTIYSFVYLKPAWKRLVMLGSAVPFAVLGNVVRLCLTIMVAEMFGQSAGKAVETYFGLLTFPVAIVGVLLLGRWLEKSEIKPVEEGKPIPP